MKCLTFGAAAAVMNGRRCQFCFGRGCLDCDVKKERAFQEAQANVKSFERTPEGMENLGEHLETILPGHGAAIMAGLNEFLDQTPDTEGRVGTNEEVGNGKKD